MEIFKWLDDSALVVSYRVNDFRKSNFAFYLNLKIHFTDNSELHVREYVDADRRKYPFHWQSESAKLIIRWDNAPHFPNIITFSHHRHLPDGVVEASSDISLDEVKGIIQAILQRG